MGGSNAKVSYSDNSSQINQSLSNIRTQINDLDKNIKEFKCDIDKHVNNVQEHFNFMDNKILLIQNEFTHSFGLVTDGIKIIGQDINKMAHLQIEYEQSNSKEHWEIFRNDWKENYLRNISEEFQKLTNLKLELELNLNRKVIEYLLVKDKFNQQLILYQEKKTQYQMAVLYNQMNQIQNHLNLSIPTEKSHVKISSLNLEFNQSDELDKLIQMEKSIEQIPILNEEIIQLFTHVDRFEEIVNLENHLRLQISESMRNFFNLNLTNPLDDIDVSSNEFALKLFNSGIKSTSQICYSNQNNLLISNGYSYVPEYKYIDLIKKFIQGCEQNNLKLYWEIDNIEWVSKYLYSKAQFKSISSMMEFARTDNCIYPILIDDSDLDKIGQIGLKLFNGLELSNGSGSGSGLELKYESNLTILYWIIKEKNIENMNLIDEKLIEDLGYKCPKKYIIKILIGIFIHMNKNEHYKFENYCVELFDDLNSQLINWIVSNYIELKNSNGLKNFQFDSINIQMANDFFSWITIEILKNYLNNVYQEFNKNKLAQIDFYNQTILDQLRINNPMVQRILTFNKLSDIKFFLYFVLEQIHTFIWNN